MVGATTPAFGTNMRITVAASQGGRRYMEDRCMIHTERNADRSINWVYVGVYDGHGGEYASQYVRLNLLDNITRNRKFDSTDDDEILEAIREGFLITHSRMRDVHKTWPYTASGYPSTAGTTVSCVFIRNGKLYTGHVGDSAIFLGSLRNGTDPRSNSLTIDHKPENLHEQERIKKAGGCTAVKSGVTRVVWRRPMKFHKSGHTENIPFLSVARSLGDLWSYCEETDEYVVSPDPDCDVYELTANDFCIVLCSDGMTNVMNGDQAISIVHEEEEQVQLDTDLNRNHSRILLKTTLQKWKNLRADNVTVATVILDEDETAYQEMEVVARPGNYASVDQALTEHPDAMLHISPTNNVLLCTQRTPVIYNGSKDLNFCRVSYRGPGFRTHEEELQEEKRNIINLSRTPLKNLVEYEEEEEEIEYDEEEDDGVEGGEALTVTSITTTKVFVFPSPTKKLPTKKFEFSPEDQGTDEEDIDKTPSKKRGKKKIVTPENVASLEVFEKRVTRSATKLKTPEIPPKTKRVIATPARKSTRKTPAKIAKTPATGKTPKSRKRNHSEMMKNNSNSEMTGITPVIGKMRMSCRSAPTTPRKPNSKSPPKNAGKSWSPSKLNSSSNSDGIQRVHENADDFEEIEEDIVEFSEPPSKMRRIYDRFKKFIWGSGSGTNSSQK
ncbi:unnamed protein product [Caenorhabditis angaria]|uniref:PPM-type phosphatase domain-containing protein n=1 Tax=Caenorhabditis angaria TaxID=860376 RepID=A0A9P1IHB0_9PELO|nr:unnamed protein product [Caenorhabditis angaria]